VRKLYIVIAVILVVGIIVAFAYFTHPHPIGTPIVEFSINVTPSSTINAAQDVTQQINVTFTSFTTKTIAVRVGVLNLVEYYNNRTNSTAYSLSYENAFNYSFTQSTLILQPRMTNTTILTINIAQDAPVGKYHLDFDVAPVNELYSVSVPLVMIVIAKP
jgi:hypothetical protein